MFTSDCPKYVDLSLWLNQLRATKKQTFIETAIRRDHTLHARNLGNNVSQVDERLFPFRFILLKDSNKYNRIAPKYHHAAN